jgi:carbonic anhydrase
VIDSSIRSAKPEKLDKLDIPDILAKPPKENSKNNGHTVEVTAPGTLTFEKAIYQLRQFHFHTPSEHRLFDEYYPLEVHFVFKGDKGKMLLTFALNSWANILKGTVVIAMFAQLSEDGSADELLQTVLRNIPKKGEETSIWPLRFGSIINNFSSNVFYRYQGSLTTPPCTPGVTFLIPNTALPLDVTTYNRAKKMMKFNSRYTQNKLDKPNLLVLASSALATLKSSPTGKSKDLLLK